MKPKTMKNIGHLFAEGTPIDAALARGVREALRRHKWAGLPVVEWRNGRIRWVAPNAIRVGHALSDGRRGRRRP